jgi:solute carrier family 25 carnitine/acylcarnitine transporter 20/29
MTTHGPRSKSALKEYGIATGIGALYGATNTIVGHPFDTVKTKMQAQAGYASGNMSATIRQIFSTDGALGFYRGCIPPMWGSAVYRSAQFAVYDLLYSEGEGVPALRTHVDPLGVGCEMELRVPLAGFCGATARTVLESPIEYAKVKGQTGQAWKLGEVYQGAGLQWARTGPMMTLYFCLFDACKRAELTKSTLGQFFCSGGSALLGFWIVWPFETLKNQTQAGMKGTVLEKVRRMPGGFLGLYRGILPGSLSVFLRNGAAMIVMQLANRKITEWGLRD